MKYISIEWSKRITQIRSKPETGSEDGLTIHEQIINELHAKLNKLIIGDVSQRSKPLPNCPNCKMKMEIIIHKYICEHCHTSLGAVGFFILLHLTLRGYAQ